MICLKALLHMHRSRQSTRQSFPSKHPSFPLPGWEPLVPGHVPSAPLRQSCGAGELRLSTQSAPARFPD